MKYCKKCVLPDTKPGLIIDSDGICSACRAVENKHKINWDARRDKLKEICDQIRGTNGNGYDCIVPVSGGKDSYFAAHIAKKFNLKALMVTYHGNNYLPEGERNLNKMKDEFGFDHIIFRPSTDTLKKLNILIFLKYLT